MQSSKTGSYKPKIIVVVGPTASGKTALAIRLAKKFHGEIVSADSRQVHRGMDIGTAKPPISYAPKGASTKSSAPIHTSGGGATFYSQGIPHHLIDIKNPNQSYTLAQYQRDAFAAIHAVLRRGNIPILVGGTGLYIDAVAENLEIPKVKPNQKLRRALEKRLASEGFVALFAELVRRDPEAAQIVDGKNPRRVIRALEVVMTSGEPFSAQRTRREPMFDTLKLGIALPGETLHKRIDARVDQMMRSGFVKEVRGLLKKYGVHQVAFDAIGYREIILYLEGKSALDDAVAMIKRNTWQYAKRQMTWFKKDKEIVWVITPQQAMRSTAQFLHLSRQVLQK